MKLFSVSSGLVRKLYWLWSCVVMNTQVAILVCLLGQTSDVAVVACEVPLANPYVESIPNVRLEEMVTTIDSFKDAVLKSKFVREQLRKSNIGYMPTKKLGTKISGIKEAERNRDRFTCMVGKNILTVASDECPYSSREEHRKKVRGHHRLRAICGFPIISDAPFYTQRFSRMNSYEAGISKIRANESQVTWLALI